MALLIVAVLGLLLSAILGRSFELSERQALEQNATVIARQAGQLWHPEPDLYRLRALLENYGALSQARLTILDRYQRPLIDVRPTDRYWASVEHSGDAGAYLYYYVAELQGGPPILRFSRGQPAATGVWVYVARAPLVSGFYFEESPGPQHSAQGTKAQRPPDVSPLEAMAPITGPYGIDGYVRISEMASYRSQILASVRQAFLWASLVAVVLAVGAGLFMSRRLSAPLSVLAWATGRMAAGDLTVRAPVRQRDEIGALASRFNEMAARLQQSFQALAADRDQLRRFVADVSHELRTPITALSTFIELLQATDDDPAARAEFLAESAAQIERLDRLTVNLLELSRLDAGLLPMELAAEDVGDLVRGTRGRWAPRAARRQVVLRLELPTTPLTVRCDRLRIEQVLDNLAGNAVKFAPEGGTVTIGARPCPPDESRASAAAGSCEVEFWVADAGPGIAPEDLPHILDRFYRGRDTGRSDGSGLGLAIVRAILAAHASTIQVQSELGQGSRFSFVLPAA
ncbi:MAG TPA: HAMP domain-containing sensor histidine kinase [Anaerolineae bacterium]|nr:HAMP domain-containing sensor histidine kinase [Anaerolineae bacterium]HPL30364.1 HAMP domain-containing sensor histidine kinase [Anaerolineae bacterium]